MKKAALSTLITILSLSFGYAQGIVGNWYGSLNVQGASLPLVLHITQNADVYSTTMDSPNQGAKDIKIEKTSFVNNQLVVESAQFGIKYTGTFLPDSARITGMFSQGGMQIPLNLTAKPGTAAIVTARPQEPKSFPYKQEEVSFANTKAQVKLAGTLTLPANGKASKVVVLISGSGPQNRDEEIAQYNQRPFLIWSDWLTRQGIAVLRYDDRGVAKSTGNFQASTSADFADDAEAAVSYLQSRPDMKGVAIGLVGHSEGGLIAPMVASRNKAVKFVVLLAGPGIPIANLMIRQTADQTRLAGGSEMAVKINTALNQKIYTEVAVSKNLSKNELETKLSSLLYENYKGYANHEASKTEVRNKVNNSLKTISSPWMRYFLAMDPALYLTKTQCPVLALNGTLDMQVNGEANLAGIRSSLQKAGNKNHQEIAMPGMNHLFQKVKTGSIAEYGQTEETVNPMVLQMVSDWINKRR